MITELKKNIEAEMRMASELFSIYEQLKVSEDRERRLFESISASLTARIKMVNSALPDMVKQISLTKKLSPDAKKEEKLETITTTKDEKQVIVKKEDRNDYLRELMITDEALKVFRRTKKKVKEDEKIASSTNVYIRFANKHFLNRAVLLSKKNFMKDLISDVQRSNLGLLSVSYISSMILTGIVSVFVGIFLTIFFLFFNIGITFPFFSLYDGSYVTRFGYVIWIALLTPILTVLGMYLYPSTEKKGLSKKIDQELPFMVIHMSSISGSGIEPTQIFNIIAESSEYKNTRGEIKKIMTQVNVYGYDLVTALMNVAKMTPSNKLAELLTGLSSAIKTGGDMKLFFDKRAETLLLNYKLEREKFAKVAETFMDIYISVVIATPMILLLLLILISVTGLSLGGLGIGALTFLIIAAVALVNVVFLVVLTVKQPGY